MVQFEQSSLLVKRSVVAGAVGLFAAFGLAACGGDDGGSDGDSGETGASESASAEESSAAVEEVAYGDGTSGDAPLEPGASAEIGAWSVSLGEVVVDATDEVLAADSSNSEPADGSIYVLVELEVTNNGDAPADPYLDLAWGIWDGAEKTGSEPLVLLPEDLSMVGEVAPGESASGNIAVEVPEGEYSTVVVGELMGDEFYFAAA